MNFAPDIGIFDLDDLSELRDILEELAI